MYDEDEFKQIVYEWKGRRLRGDIKWGKHKLGMLNGSVYWKEVAHT